MVKLWRCEICGDPYIGDEAPANCPFCGAKEKYIKEFADAGVNFDVELNEKDKANVEKALQVEVSNTACVSGYPNVCATAQVVRTLPATGELPEILGMSALLGEILLAQEVSERAQAGDLEIVLLEEPVDLLDPVQIDLPTQGVALEAPFHGQQGRFG